MSRAGLDLLLHLAGRVLRLVLPPLGLSNPALRLTRPRVVDRPEDVDSATRLPGFEDHVDVACHLDPTEVASHADELLLEVRGESLRLSGPRGSKIVGASVTGQSVRDGEPAYGLPRTERLDAAGAGDQRLLRAAGLSPNSPLTMSNSSGRAGAARRLPSTEGVMSIRCRRAVGPRRARCHARRGGGSSAVDRARDRVANAGEGATGQGRGRPRRRFRAQARPARSRREVDVGLDRPVARRPELRGQESERRGDSLELRWQSTDRACTKTLKRRLADLQDEATHVSTLPGPSGIAALGRGTLQWQRDNTASVSWPGTRAQKASFSSCCCTPPRTSLPAVRTALNQPT